MTTCSHSRVHPSCRRMLAPRTAPPRISGPDLCLHASGTLKGAMARLPFPRPCRLHGRTRLLKGQVDLAAVRPLAVVQPWGQHVLDDPAFVQRDPGDMPGAAVGVVQPHRHLDRGAGAEEGVQDAGVGPSNGVEPAGEHIDVLGEGELASPGDAGQVTGTFALLAEYGAGHSSGIVDQ